MKSELGSGTPPMESEPVTVAARTASTMRPFVRDEHQPLFIFRPGDRAGRQAFEQAVFLPHLVELGLPIPHRSRSRWSMSGSIATDRPTPHPMATSVRHDRRRGAGWKYLPPGIR